MKQTTPLAILLILVSALTYLTLPAKTDDFNQKKRLIELNASTPIKLDAFKSEIKSVPSAAKLISPLSEKGYQVLSSNLDFNRDSFNDIFLIKKVFEPVSASKNQKNTSNEILVHGLTIINIRNEKELLSLKAEGIFQDGVSVLPVNTPVFGYKIMLEKLNSTSILVVKVELINSDHESISDQLAIYWDKNNAKVIATNEFEL